MRRLTAVLLLLGIIASGTISHYTSLFQNRQIVEEECSATGTTLKHFNHPVIQVLLVFLGEALCLLNLCRRAPIPENTQPLMNPEMQQMFASDIDLITPVKPLPLQYYYAGTALLYFLMAMGHSIALIALTPRVYMMCRVLVLFTIKLFSWILSREDWKKHQKYSVIFILLGISGAAAADFLNTDSQSFNSLQAGLGFAMLLLVLLAEGLYAACEQYMLRKCNVTEIKLVAMEGLYGFIIAFVFMWVAMLIPCPFSENGYCVCVDGQLYLDNPIVYFEELTLTLSLLGLGTMISTACFNLAGVYITSRINAFARGASSFAQQSLIWIMGIVLNLVYGNEQFTSKFWLNIVIKLVAFGLLIAALLYYKKVITSKRGNIPAEGEIIHRPLLH